MCRLIGYIILTFMFNQVWASTIEVEQPKLKSVIGCYNSNRSICFESAQFYKEYNLYIFNFKAVVNDDNLKGLTVVEHIRNTMGQIYAFINPVASNIYGIEPILMPYVDDSQYKAVDIVFGLNTKYKDETYVSYMRSFTGEQLSLNSDVVKSDMKPADLLIKRCNEVKSIIGVLDEQLNEKFCYFKNNEVEKIK